MLSCLNRGPPRRDRHDRTVMRSRRGQSRRFGTWLGGTRGDSLKLPNRSPEQQDPDCGQCDAEDRECIRRVTRARRWQILRPCNGGGCGRGCWSGRGDRRRRGCTRTCVCRCGRRCDRRSRSERGHLARGDQTPEREVVDNEREKCDEENEPKDCPEPQSACRDGIVAAHGTPLRPVFVFCFRG